MLLRTLPGAQPAGGGLRVRQGEGWVTLVPLARSAVLRIVGEARSAELAEELCAFCARRAERPTGACRKNRGILFRKGMVY